MVKIQRGKALKKKLIPVNILQNIFKHVEMSGECILWNGCVCSWGYPRMKMKGKARFVHRVMYALFIEDLRYGTDVHHKCLNTRCINPLHLEQVTRKKHVGLHYAETD